jgi:asparagine N-glycosylation enzyme membrane subunit Stt3
MNAYDITTNNKNRTPNFHPSVEEKPELDDDAIYLFLLLLFLLLLLNLYCYYYYSRVQLVFVLCMYVCMYVRSSFIVYCFSKRLANYVLPFAVCCADKMINMSISLGRLAKC